MRAKQIANLQHHADQLVELQKRAVAAKARAAERAVERAAERKVRAKREAELVKRAEKAKVGNGCRPGSVLFVSRVRCIRHELLGLVLFFASGYGLHYFGCGGVRCRGNSFVRLVLLWYSSVYFMKLCYRAKG